MRVYTTNAISPYEFMSELLLPSGSSEPFRVLQEDDFHKIRIYEYKGSQFVRPFVPVMRWMGSDPTSSLVGLIPDSLLVIPSSNNSIVHLSGLAHLSGLKCGGTIIGYGIDDVPDPLTEWYVVIPHPKQSYTEIVNEFLSERMPPIEIAVGGTGYHSSVADPVSVEEFSVETSCVTNAEYRIRRTDDSGSDWTDMVFYPKVCYRLDYPTRLDFLLEFPMSDMNPMKLVTISTNGAILVKFNYPREPVLVLFLNMDTWTGDLLWIRTTRHLFADTLAMSSVIFGPTTLTHSEIAFLMLDFWSMAVGSLSKYITSQVAKRTSMLLLYDMLHRVENMDIVAQMLERVTKRPFRFSWSTKEFLSGDLHGKRRWVHAQSSIYFDHIQILKVWNLLRTQIGLDPITRKNYLEVPHALADTA